MKIQDSPRSRHAVVTGGAGFLGSHLSRSLLERGWEVTIIDNLLTGHRINLHGLTDLGPVRFLEADITESVRIPGPVDAVLHFASPASPSDYLRLPIETLRVGSAGTMHALDIARDKGARFVLASTSEVYGDPREHPQRESYWGHVNPVGPRGVYDEAKRFAEAMTMAYRRTYGVSTGIVRIFNTFGPNMRWDDGRAIPVFFQQALSNEPVTVTGDGEQTRSFCYVDDLIRGIVAMVESTHPGPINLGNPVEWKVIDLARYVVDLVGSRSPITFIGRPEDDPMVRRPDVSLANQELGWAAQTSIESGLEKTYHWFARRHRELTNVS